MYYCCWSLSYASPIHMIRNEIMSPRLLRRGLFHFEAANTITRLIHTRYSITREQKKSLKEAITKVLTEIALPLELKSLIK